MLGKCFGLCGRTEKFFKQHKQDVLYPGSGEFIEVEKMQDNGFNLSIINKFGDLDGFKRIKELIKVKEDFRCPI
jgi:hypothetical protein